MADPDIRARKKPKRKRWAALPEPEEVASEILNELQRSRIRIDKKLAKYNDAVMQIQVRERQRFIENCATHIRDLHDSVKPIVVVQLLSNEDFAVEMNFSELHTSSPRSLLTWSCTDDALSEPSWKTVLQQCAEGASASSSRTTRATSKGSSPPAPSSTPIAEPAGHPKSMASSKVGMNTDKLIEKDGADGDLLTTSGVTISRHGKANARESPAAPLTHESPSIRGRRAPAGRGRPLKRRTLRWSQQELDILRNQCNDKLLHRATSPFWEHMAAKLPERTKRACFMKWKEIRGKEREMKKATDSLGTRDSGGINFDLLDVTQPQGVPNPSEDGELMQENVTTREREGYNEGSSNEENAAVL